jgi:hypothetical protein
MPRIEFSNEFLRYLENTNIVLLHIDEKVVPRTSQEVEILQRIHLGINLMNMIIVNKKFRFDDDPKKFKVEWRKYQHQQTLLLKLSENISIESITLSFPNSNIHPYIELFLMLKELRFENWRPFNKKYAIENKALERIRIISKQKQFRLKVDAFRKGPDENSRKLRNFVTQCLRVEETLNFVRLDLYSEIGRSIPSNQPRTNPLTIKGYFNRLISHLRTKLLKESMLGYAWKLSYSAFTQYRYQIFIFCLPVDLETDKSIGDLIGSYWEKLTGGMGVFKRHIGVSFTKAAYDAGCLNWRIPEARNRLRELSKEVFVNDYYIQSDLGRSSKSFGISEVIDPRESAAERRKRKTIQKERQEKQKRYLSELKLPFELRKPPPPKKTKNTKA